MRVASLLIALVLGALAPSPAAESQDGKRLPRVGILSASRCPSPPSVGPFLQGLQDLGYIPGRTVAVECRAAEGRYERLPALAAELVQARMDVIYAATHPDAVAAKEATSTIPIVMVVTGDPVAHGLVASLARPGGNITGLHYYATELSAKRLELLRDAVPGLTRVAVLAHPVTASLTRADTEGAARSLGLQLLFVEVREPAELAGAFQTMVRQRVDGLVVLPDVMFSMEARQIVDLALRARLPSMSPFASFARAGGLMAYGADSSVLARRAAVYVDKILKGARPAELPVEQPTRFELVVNLRTAKALGLTLPPALLFRAETTIE